MKLDRSDFEFNNNRICHMSPKHIELERLLINLFMLLKYSGRRPVAKVSRKEVTVEYVFKQLVQLHGDKLQGFAENPEVIRDWIYSDLLDIVYRGVPDKETVASPRPLHLNAFKLRNPRQAKDYRGAEQIYSMISRVDPELVKRLAKFLGQGMDLASYETYDGITPLDLDTLMIVRMVDNVQLKENASGSGNSLEPPLCIGQARLFCSDLRRLMAYEKVIPRSVFIEYLKNICGLHLGLYLLRLFHQLSGWLHDKEAHSACLNCPVDVEDENPFGACPYAFQNPDARLSNNLQFEILVDMGESYTSHMAELSRKNCAQHYSAINEYIQSVFTVNQLFRFSESFAGNRIFQTKPQTVAEVLNILSNPPESLDNYFSQRIDNILSPQELEDEREEVLSIREMKDLKPMETFIQLVSLERSRYYRKYITEQLDSVLMKNTNSGLLRQGKGQLNKRRWHIGSRLLETLVQIAVLEPKGNSEGFCSRPILIDEFVTWLRNRYSLVLMPAWANATIDDYKAFNANLRLLKERLREIGFYIDLSDSYNAQTIRPRYPIGSQAGVSNK